MSAVPEAEASAIGRFSLIQRIGVGAMGEVYRAKDTVLSRTVALKVLPAHFAADAERLRRFQLEAIAASALNHVNIVTIYDAGVTNGTPWIAMEYVEGRTLRAMLAEGRPSPAETQRISVQVAEGLARAHEAGIIHRDLKPENIMITSSGAVKILDFGLAKLHTITLQTSEAETQAMTSPGVICGTPGYMSPEQAAGRPLDHRSDQFSAGEIFYEMAAGQHPFRRESAPETMAAILEAKPRPLRELNSQLPDSFCSAVDRCLAKDPTGRFDSTLELATALTALPLRRVSAPRRSMIIAVCVSVLIAALAGLAWWRLRPSTSTRPMPIVAVRTFRNMSADTGKDYFAGGISEEVRNQLSRIASLRMLSRSAVDRYKDGENRRLGTEMKATRVVEGSIRADAQRLRVSVQLLDPVTEQTLWSDQFDRPLAEALTVQGELALRIAQALQTKITPSERVRLAKRPTDNPAAYDVYLRAARVGIGDRVKGPAAIELMKEAIRLDPKFAEAMAAIAYRLIYIRDGKSVKEGLEWARRAVATDPESVRGHTALAGAYTSLGFISKARVEFTRAIELDPNNELAVANLGGAILDLGQFEEGLHWIRLGYERNPAGGPQCGAVGSGLIAYADLTSARKWLDACVARFPTNLFIKGVYITLLGVEGNWHEAWKQSVSLTAKYPERSDLATYHADLAVLLQRPEAQELYEKMDLSVEPSFSQWGFLPESQRPRLAWFAQRRNDSATANRLLSEAETAAMRAWDNAVESPLVPYELAVVWSLRNRPDNAMLWMQRAYDRGWRHYKVNRYDPMLANMRPDSRFQKLNDRMEADVERMRRESTEIPALFEKTLPGLIPLAR